MARLLSPPRVEALAWTIVLIVGAVALAALSYGVRDADSRLYSQMAARMATESPEQWIAPRFPPGWFMSGLFREHPVGIHLLPAFLARLGYPSLQAALAVNGLYVALGLVLLKRLAATVAGEADGRALAWLMQLLPIAFTFRIRANHEAAVLLCLLIALYGVERARTRRRYGLLVVAGLVGLLLVKGVLVVMGFLACALWLLTRDDGTPTARNGWAWASILVAAVGVAGTALAYEVLYRQTTGEPFWSFYLGRQLGVASVDQSAAGLAQKAYNFLWYLGRVLWFPFPWSLTFVVAVIRGWWPRKRSPDGAARAGPSGALFVLCLTALYLGAFSLSDRRADRYIFPVYYAVGSAGAIVALRAWPRLRSFADRVDRAGAWVPAALWLALFAVHVLSGRLGVPTVKIWAPDT